MKLLNESFIIGLIFSAFAAVIYFQTTELPPQVAIFPKICSAIIALTGLTAIIKSFFERSKADLKGIFTKQVGVVTLLLVITYGLIIILGFYAASFLFVFFMYLYADGEWKKISFVKGGIFSTATTITLYILFDFIMNLVTPEGILT